MSRVVNPVSKLSRALGSTTTTTRPVVESSGLTPAYAELLRSHRRNQWDNHPLGTTTKPYATTPLSPPTTHPINLPTQSHTSSFHRHTPVPIISRPKMPPAAASTVAREPNPAPEVVVIANDPNNVAPSLEELDNIDVDEVQLKSTKSRT